MISLSQILPRAQRHTSFTVTSGLAVATETGGEEGLVEGVCVCVCGGGRLRGGPPPTLRRHQQPPSAALLDEKRADNAADWI